MFNNIFPSILLLLTNPDLEFLFILAIVLYTLFVYKE